MMNNRRWLSHIVLFALGVGLIIAGGMEMVDDYWSGFGGGMAGVAVVRLIIMYRYSHNEEYRKNVNVNAKDERNKFIASQARNWSMFLSVVILGILCIVFQIMGQPLLSQFCGLTVCGMVVIYWVSYLLLRRKY